MGQQDTVNAINEFLDTLDDAIAMKRMELGTVPGTAVDASAAVGGGSSAPGTGLMVQSGMGTTLPGQSGTMAPVAVLPETQITEGAKSARKEGATGTGLVPIPDNERRQLSTGKRNFFANTVKDIISFARSALTKKGGPERLYMGVIPDNAAKKVMEQTGFNVTGFKAVLTGDAVQHTYVHHGDPITEGKRGQRAVTPEDYAMLGKVLAEPDDVWADGGLDSFGRPVIMFSKKIGDVFVTAQAFTEGRHTLTTNSMRIQKKKGHQDTMPDAGTYDTSPVLNVQNAPSEGPSVTRITHPTQDVNLRRSLPGDIPADIPPGLRKLYRLAQEMSASPPPREIPQRPVQQSPQEILSQLAREMTMDPQAREIPQRPVQQSPQEILTQLAKEMAQDPSSPLADLSDEDLADILSSIAPEGKGASQDIEGTSPGTSVEIRTVDFANKASVMEQLTLAQKETAELDHEVCYSVTADGKVWKVSGEAGAVNPSAIPSSLAGSYSFHNHPRAKTWFSFSPADVRFFFQSGEQFAKAADYLYEYTMERTEDTVDIDPDVVYHRFKEIEDTEVAQLKWDRLIDPDLDGYHETMKRLSKELKFYYERKERQ